MGAPEYLSAVQLSQLEASSALTRDALPFVCDGGTVDLKVGLPPQSVAAITIEFE